MPLSRSHVLLAGSRLGALRFRRLLLAGLALLAAEPVYVSPIFADEPFLEFPLVEQISGAVNAEAVLWTVRKGAQTSLQFAAAPAFAPMTLLTRSDADGQPLVDNVLSPDGRLAVFQTAEAHGGEHSYNPAGLIERPRPKLWLIATRSGAMPREIGFGADAEFSPAGRLLYRHDGDLVIVSFAGDIPQTPLTIKGGARFQDIAWLPDESAFVFTEDRGGFSFIGTYRLGADRVDWLVTGPDRLTTPILSPDGRQVAYRRFAGREHSRSYDQTAYEPFAIETIDLASRATRVWWRTEAPSAAATDDGGLRIYVIKRGAGAPAAMSAPNCEVAESEFLTPATLAMIHNCSDLDKRQLSLVDLPTGRETAIRLDDVVIASLSKAGERYLALVGATADSPPLLRVLDRRSGKVVFAEHADDFGWRASFTAPRPTAVRFQASDGLQVHAQLFLPAGRGKHPALIYVHGGPQRQMFPGFHFMRYYANDYAANRQFAQRGYVVLSVNYRSSTGYGREFREAPGRGWRGASEYADVQAAARFLAARSDVDPDRLGIWGGSYGGLLAAQALARDSALFKAGVAVHGVFDWSWPTERPEHLNPSRFFGVGVGERALAHASSPLGAIDGWRSPVLLFSGDEDANVDVLETVDLTQKLRARGVEVQTTIVPGEAHDFVRHSTWQLLWRQACAFFDSKLGDADSTAPCE